MFWRKSKSDTTDRSLDRLQLSIDPVDGTIPSVSVQKILEEHNSLIRLLRNELNFRKEELDCFFEQPIRIVAEYCHALPASFSGEYRHAGGLFEKCLRTSFVAHRMAHGMIAASELSADARSLAEMSWHYAAFLAGLIYPLGVLSELGATLSDGKGAWTLISGPLAKWLEDKGATRYTPHWQNYKDRYIDDKAARIWVLSRVFTEQHHRFITRETHRYLEQLIAVLVGGHHKEDMLETIMQRAIDESINMETNSRLKDVRGRHIENTNERIRTALSVAFHTKTLRFIRETPFCTDGERIYGYWPKLADYVKAVAATEGIIGIPDDHDQLLQHMIEAELIVRQDDGNWMLQLMASGKGMSFTVEAVEFDSKTGWKADPSMPIVQTPDQPAHHQKPTDPPHEQQEIKHAVDQGESSKDEDGDLQKGKEKPEVPAANDQVEKAPKNKPALSVTKAADEISGNDEELPPRNDKHDKKPEIQSKNRNGTQTLEGVLAGLNPKSMGWQTQHGWALPWPRIAHESGVSQQEFLRLLKDSEQYIPSDSKMLPLLHELARKDGKTMAIILKKDYWEKINGR